MFMSKRATFFFLSESSYVIKNAVFFITVITAILEKQLYITIEKLYLNFGAIDKNKVSNIHICRKFCDSIAIRRLNNKHCDYLSSILVVLLLNR